MILSKDALERYRSLLFVPVTEPRFLTNIAQRGAGAVILDLEDAIAPEKKLEARQSLAQMSARLRELSIPTIVRVNAGDMEDVDAAIRADVNAILVPKVQSPEDLQIVAERIKRAAGENGGADNDITMLALIETPTAVMRVAEIAHASKSLVGLILGGEDLCMMLGIEPSLTGLNYAASQLIIAARSAGVVPMGLPGPLSLIDDMAGYRETVAIARQMGMVGAVCIHPNQVGIVNDVFGDLNISYEDACAIVQAFEDGLKIGKGAVKWNGRMLDLPIVERAREIMSLRN